MIAIGCAVRAAFAPGDRRRLLNLAPLLTMLLDYTENALGIYLVGAFPARHELLVWLSVAVTDGKWRTPVCAHAVLAWVALLVAWRVDGKVTGSPWSAGAAPPLSLLLRRLGWL